jgi:hypothetical protein
MQISVAPPVNAKLQGKKRGEIMYTIKCAMNAEASAHTLSNARDLNEAVMMALDLRLQGRAVEVFDHLGKPLPVEMYSPLESGAVSY